MNIKQTIINIILIVVFAATTLTLSIAAEPVSAAKCGGVETSVFSCDAGGGGTCPDGSTIPADRLSEEKCADGSNAVVTLEQTGLWGILLTVINILTAGIGLVAIGGIIYASILYTSAGGSQEQVKKSMGIITNVVIGVVAYALMYSGLNFLIPGGVFN